MRVQGESEEGKTKRMEEKRDYGKRKKKEERRGKEEKSKKRRRPVGEGQRTEHRDDSPKLPHIMRRGTHHRAAAFTRPGPLKTARAVANARDRSAVGSCLAREATPPMHLGWEAPAVSAWAVDPPRRRFIHQAEAVAGRVCFRVRRHKYWPRLLEHLTRHGRSRAECESSLGWPS